MASSWFVAVGYCVRALLNKPREFGLGSCDEAWRGHFFRNLHLTCLEHE